jgi:hypothetical protein
LRALYWRHEKLVKEMKRRGWQHHSPLDKRLARGRATPLRLVDSLSRQRQLLVKKECDCPLG